MIKSFCALMLSALLFTQPVLAEPSFPKLKGRVSDYAGLIDARLEKAIAGKLKAHESATKNQIVVATLKDLQGYSIEEYGYQLARHWGIGQEKTNKGVLILLAKKERKVRIEVGYGLEGELTDAISASIIQHVMLPEFKRGRFGEGLALGADSVVEALGGKYAIPKKQRRSSGSSDKWLFLVLFIFIPFINSFGGIGRGRRGRRRHYVGGMPIGGGFGSSGGGFGGGFSGGGGGFGGGGASGGW